MTDQTFLGSAPVAEQLAQVLQAGMGSAIEAYNADQPGFALDQLVSIIGYLPPPGVLAGGCPVIGVGEGAGPSRLEDDLVHTVTAAHPLLINVYVQQSDHQALVKQLRGYLTVILRVLNADRLLGAAAVMAAPPANVWHTRIIGTNPGFALDLSNPDAPQESPRSWLSWAGVRVECHRSEI